jgi:hypothetical protein
MKWQHLRDLGSVVSMTPSRLLRNGAVWEAFIRVIQVPRKSYQFLIKNLVSNSGNQIFWPTSNDDFDHLTNST